MRTAARGAGNGGRVVHRDDNDKLHRHHRFRDECAAELRVRLHGRCHLPQGPQDEGRDNRPRLRRTAYDGCHDTLELADNASVHARTQKHGSRNAGTGVPAVQYCKGRHKYLPPITMIMKN